MVEQVVVANQTARNAAAVDGRVHYKIDNNNEQRNTFEFLCDRAKMAQPSSSFLCLCRVHYTLKKKWFFEKKWPAFFCFCRFHYNFCFYQKSFFEQTKMADLLLPLLSPLEIKIKSFPRKKWRTFSFLCRVHYKINKKKCSFSSKKKMAGLLLPYPFLFWMELQ